MTSALTYNGLMPGPTVRIRKGQNALIALQNNLLDPTTIHWHGLVVPEAMDGGPRYPVAPGGNYIYQFPIIQRAGTYWYHPHPHMLTAREVHLGLAGLFFVEDAEEDALNLPAGQYEVPLVLRDASLDANGQLQYIGGMGSFLGSVMLANGVRDATLDVEATRYRFRVLNGSNTRVFTLALSNGMPFTLIGTDGGLLRVPATVGAITLSPGERVDVLVSFSAVPLGTAVMLQSRQSSGNLDLVEFVVRSQGPGVGPLPSVLSTVNPLTRSAVQATRSFRFSGSTTINGAAYKLNTIAFQVPLGRTELWKFTNGGTNPAVTHPVHVHGASFNVSRRIGGRGQVFPWERGWKDTVYVRERETVEVLIRFNDYRGLYVLHCHRLEHEDRGMMMNFRVT
jgi:FtsP/CotA-like multicopper oxidase with cupredoxin domain